LQEKRKSLANRERESRDKFQTASGRPDSRKADNSEYPQFRARDRQRKTHHLGLLAYGMMLVLVE